MCRPGFQRLGPMCSIRVRDEQHSELDTTCQCPLNMATLCFVIIISIAVCHCSDDSSEVDHEDSLRCDIGQWMFNKECSPCQDEEFCAARHRVVKYRCEHRSYLLPTVCGVCTSGFYKDPDINLPSLDFYCTPCSWNAPRDTCRDWRDQQLTAMDTTSPDEQTTGFEKTSSDVTSSDITSSGEASDKTHCENSKWKWSSITSFVVNGAVLVACLVVAMVLIYKCRSNCRYKSRLCCCASQVQRRNFMSVRQNSLIESQSRNDVSHDN